MRGDPLKQHNFTEARRVCEEMGGHLPEVRSHPQFLEANRIQAGVGSFWLDATPVPGPGGVVEGAFGVGGVSEEWRWLSDGELVAMDRFWSESAPDGGDCLTMNYYRSSRIEDAYCFGHWWLVCDLE